MVSNLALTGSGGLDVGSLVADGYDIPGATIAPMAFGTPFAMMGAAISPYSGPLVAPGISCPSRLYTPWDVDNSIRDTHCPHIGP